MFAFDNNTAVNHAYDTAVNPPAIVREMEHVEWARLRIASRYIGTDGYSRDSETVAAAYGTSSSYRMPAAAVPVRLDPWYQEVLEQITAYRDPSWLEFSGIEPNSRALDVAEDLARVFSAVPVNKRPQFAVNADGEVGFAHYDDHRYLHLEVEPDGFISWLCVVDGVETYRDGVELSNEESQALLEELVALLA